MEHMEIEVVHFERGQELTLRTPGRYSMGHAIHALKYLEENHNAEVSDTGWSSGFGLEVAVDVPIKFEQCTASMATNGVEIYFKRIAGSKQQFDEVFESIHEHI